MKVVNGTWLHLIVIIEDATVPILLRAKREWYPPYPKYQETKDFCCTKKIQVMKVKLQI